MNIQIASRNLPITDSIRQHVSEKLEGLKKYYDSISFSRVTITRDKHHHKGDVFGINVVVDLPKRGPVSVMKRAFDFHAGFDDVVDTLRNIIKKQREKKQTHLKEKTS